MINSTVLVGRLTRDPELKYTGNNVAVASFSLAVNRNFKDANGERETDFINCIAFGKSGEFAEKYFHRGLRVLISGRIQTGSYTNRDGQKVYTTDIVVEEIEFGESKGSNQSQQKSEVPHPETDPDGFMSIPDGIDEELPFA